MTAPGVPHAEPPVRQARGTRRRAELLDATVRLIARAGVAAVTHRAVAAEAGVSHRLTTYYFQTKDQMVVEAFRHLAARSVERTRAAAALIADAARTIEWRNALEVAIDAIVDHVLDASNGDPREDASAELSMVLEIQRHHELASDYAAWQDQVESILVEHAKAMHATNPVQEARLLHASMRGLRMELLARPDRPTSRSELRELVSRLLTSL
ncbi:MAG: TetR/AcrR family transcriptional regulator [Myxococcota bacterium]